MLASFSAMQVGAAYQLPRRGKSGLAVKLLAARLLRRYLIILGLRRFSVRLTGATAFFKALWAGVSAPLEEIFFHPIRGDLVGDLTFLLRQSGSKTSAISQFYSFFTLQHAKYEPHYSLMATSGNFEHL